MRRFEGTAWIIDALCKEFMLTILVRRDQFNITPQGIVHKPTDAAFTPFPGDPYSGITRMGHLGNQTFDGKAFNADDVQRMMRDLWVEYVISNLQHLKSVENQDLQPTIGDRRLF